MLIVSYVLTYLIMTILTKVVYCVIENVLLRHQVTLIVTHNFGYDCEAPPLPSVFFPTLVGFS